jgi:hypothetical protein
MKRKPMFEQMADEIAAAVVGVVENHRDQIKKRKCSPHLVGYWISEGARRGASIVAYKKPNARIDGQKEAR